MYNFKLKLKQIHTEYFCFLLFLQFIVLRWILSRTFKDDINTDYGIYTENGDYIVMEAVDRNAEYEQQAAATEERQDYENWEDEYDKMYS